MQTMFSWGPAIFFYDNTTVTFGPWRFTIAKSMIISNNPIDW